MYIYLFIWLTLYFFLLLGLRLSSTSSSGKHVILSLIPVPKQKKLCFNFFLLTLNGRHKIILILIISRNIIDSFVLTKMPIYAYLKVSCTYICIHKTFEWYVWGYSHSVKLCLRVEYEIKNSRVITGLHMWKLLWVKRMVFKVGDLDPFY